MLPIHSYCFSSSSSQCCLDSMGVSIMSLDAHFFKTMDFGTNILCISVLKMGRVYSFPDLVIDDKRRDIHE